MADCSTKKVLAPPIIWMLYLALFAASFKGLVQADCRGYENPKPDIVPMEWKGECYIFADGLTYCEGINESCEILGGTSAKIVSLEQQRHFFREIVSNVYYGNDHALSDFWIGLKYDPNSGHWKWENGDPVTWTNWKTRPHKNNCLAVQDLEGTWTEHDASYFTDGFICHISKTRTKTTTPPSTTRTSTTTTSALTTALATTGSATPTNPVREATAEITAEPTTLEAKSKLNWTESTTLGAKVLESQRSPPAKTRHQVTQRTVIFEAIRDKGQPPYLSAKPNAVVEPSSFISCCSKCMLLDDCSLINYNNNERLCHLFVGREVLQRVDQEPGWIVFVKKFVD